MSFFADLVQAVGSTAMVAVDIKARQATAQQGGHSGKPGCTPCAAIARRQRAQAFVSKMQK